MIAQLHQIHNDLLVIAFVLGLIAGVVVPTSLIFIVRGKR